MGISDHPKPVIQVSVGELFASGNCYRIPDHQRPYEWTPTDVETLLNDVYRRRERGREGLGGYYQFNAMTWWADDGCKVLFDGQQRLTTLYLSIAAALKIIVEALAVHDVPVEARERLQVSQQTLLSALRMTDMSGSASLRLVDQFKDSNDSLSRIVAAATTGKGYSGKDGYSRAFRAATDWFNATFSHESAVVRAERIRSYLEYLFTRGVFSIHQVATEEDGWDAFDKANNRGRQPTEADRLKHWLWGQAVEKDRPQLVADWNAMMLETRKNGVDIDDVISVVLTADFARPVDNSISRKKIFKCVLHGGSAHAKAVADPAAFVRTLRSAAHVALELSNGRGGSGAVPAVQVLRHLYGKVPTQVLPLLVAGRSLTPAQFNRFATALLDTWIVHDNSGALPQVFTKARATWLSRVRNVKDEADLDKILNVELAEFKAKGKEGFANWFRTLSLVNADGETVKSDERLIRFILGKCDEALALEVAKRPVRPDSFVEEYLGSARTAEVEHILPQVFDEVEAEESFGGIDNAKAVAETIGNLTLLTKPENSTASNKGYFDKSEGVYKVSAFYITRALHEATTGQLGSRLSVAPIWNLDAILARHVELYRITCHLLGVPEVETFVPSTPSLRMNRLGFRMVQADSGGLLVALAQAVMERQPAKVRRELVSANGGDPDRRHSYYMAALRELGIVVKNGANYELAENHEVAPSERDIAHILLAHPASQLIEALGKEGFKEKVCQESDLSEVTAGRRADAHIALRDWALAILEEN